MARGWESKAVEAQQEEAAQNKTSAKPRLTQEQVDRARELASLQLSLKGVVQQLSTTANARHRSMLELAKTELERKIEVFEAQWSVH